MSDRAHLFLCDCLGSQAVDPESASAAADADAAPLSTHLCRKQIGRVAKAMEAGEQVIVACGQEQTTFLELAAELGAEDRLACVDIRDRAGWTDAAESVAPKQAALLAEARTAARPTPALTLRSDGACLIIGAAEVAVPAAEKLADALVPTVLIPTPEPVFPPMRPEVSLATGRVASAEGWLGAFGVKIDALAEAEPGGRGMIGFGEPQNGGRTECDIILDLSGGAPLFPAHEGRDGYVKADPKSPGAVADAVLKASQLVGEFEKPIYIDFDAQLCAHTRAGQSGCDRCLQVCPASAITPDGDAVRIDPNICAGCGACAAVCPSGAASYDYPDTASLWRRLDALARGWRGAGGKAFRLLIHDADGLALIEASARFGRGLPADVIPFALNKATQADHALMLAALGAGAAEVVTHLHPKHADHAAHVGAQILLGEAMAAGAGVGEGRLRVVETDDPDALEAALWTEAAQPTGVEPITPLGARRSVARQAMRALAVAAGPGAAQAEIALPADLFPSGAPYGAITVDTDACTLCLACVSVCPAGAMLDNPDMPQLRFLEDACLQCGICANACPETAITMEPRYLNTPAATQTRVLNEAEPFPCVSCGKPFGVKQTIERIAEKLVGKHWMFAEDSRAKLIQMCDDCRVRAQYHSTDNPFAMGTRPHVRRTEDYLEEREAESGRDRKDH